MFETNYRIVFLKSAARFLTPPLLIAYFISRFYLNTLNAFVTPFIYLAAILAWSAFLIQYRRLYQYGDARRRDAVMVPEVRGRLPGNFDIIARCDTCPSTFVMESADR